MTPTILIVDDHEAFRASLGDWLNAHFPQCSIFDFDNGKEAVAFARTISPTIVIMDISMPGLDGIEATQQIKTAAPDVKIIILTIHEDQIYHAHALAAGASAYIPKHRMRTELQPTLTRLLAQRGT